MTRFHVEIDWLYKENKLLFYKIAYFVEKTGFML